MTDDTCMALECRTGADEAFYVGRRADGRSTIHLVTAVGVRRLDSGARPQANDLGWGADDDAARQTASAIATDLLDVVPSDGLLTLFVSGVVARIDRDSFTLTAADVLHWFAVRMPEPPRARLSAPDSG
jgi:hypothetical protein